MASDDSGTEGGKLGFAVSGGPTATEIVHLAVLAEAHGYDSFWVAEGHGGDQFAVLAACAQATSRIQLGTSISSVFVRTAPTLAMAAATVDELSQGRFILGLGSSHRVQVVPEHGVEYGKPLTRCRETIEFIRALMRDGEAGYAGQTVNIDKFDLWFEPRRVDFPIYLAAVFPKMTELAGELADGLILTRSTLRTAAQVGESLRAGAARAGRDADDVEVTSLLPTCIAERAEDAFDGMRPGLAFYAGFFPRYNRLIAEHGFADEAARIRALWEAGDQAGAQAAVTNEMLSATGVVGTPESSSEQIAAYRQSGITVPIVSPFARGPGAVETFERALLACAGA